MAIVPHVGADSISAPNMVLMTDELKGRAKMDFAPTGIPALIALTLDSHMRSEGELSVKASKYRTCVWCGWKGYSKAAHRKEGKKAEAI